MSDHRGVSPRAPLPSADLIDALRAPACYPHPVAEVQLVETHISWVLLAGEYAYKLKKPVDFGFLDFSTLEKRRACCDEELRLNRRLAPQLYLDVVAITGTIGAPRVGGCGTVLEYAVRMRRFRREDELDTLADRNALTAAHIEALARDVARFHASVAVAAPEGPWGTPERVLAPCLENFAHLRALDHETEDLTRIAALEAWTRAEHARLVPVMTRRLADGFVRECHGDLHLANIVLIAGHPVVFDAIEFNPALRWIDVVSEIAFCLMDLHHRGRHDLASRFLNTWLAETGDYEGLALLRFHLVYRAMVRAKVAALRAAQAPAHSRERRALVADLRAHLALARRLSSPSPRALLITHGVSGSGKSHAAALLAETGDWVHLRSDVERKRLAGLSPLARSGSAPGADLYAPEMNARTYARLAALARVVLGHGYPVIVDATFLARSDRDTFRALAREAGASFALLSLTAPAGMLQARVRARERLGADPSEATLAVLERQLTHDEALGDDERRAAVCVDSAEPTEGATLARRVAARLSA